MVAVFCCSDAILTSLDPVDPVVFDASRLTGIGATHLVDLMSLTFLSDEKLASNPLSPPAQPPTVPPSLSSRLRDEIEAEQLAKKMDEDLSRVFAEDREGTDHNADKKSAAATYDLLLPVLT